MHANVYAHCATVFLGVNFDQVDKLKLQNDYHQMYHSKRPEQPITSDSFHFVIANNTADNLAEIEKVDALISKAHLRAVNFILLDDPNEDLDKVSREQLMNHLKKWDGHFRSNSFNGPLVLGIATVNYEALLIEGYQVRGINRLSLGLS